MSFCTSSFFYICWSKPNFHILIHNPCTELFCLSAFCYLRQLISDLKHFFLIKEFPVPFSPLPVPPPHPLSPHHSIHMNSYHLLLLLFQCLFSIKRSVLFKCLKWSLEYCKHVLRCTFVDAVDEKRLAERIQALKKEKDDALTKVSALQKQVSPPAYNT